MDIKAEVQKRIRDFEKELSEEYDNEVSGVSDEEQEQELLFEHFLANKEEIIKPGLTSKLYSVQNTRRDLADVLNLKNNEPQLRKFIAGILREMREEAKNGYRELTPEEQEKILNCRIGLLGSLLSNCDIFFSRKKMEYDTYCEGYGKKLQALPLRKDLTIGVMRIYGRKNLLLADND